MSLMKFVMQHYIYTDYLDFLNLTIFSRMGDMYCWLHQKFFRLIITRESPCMYLIRPVLKELQKISHN
jgi:hypothetical protein